MVGKLEERLPSQGELKCLDVMGRGIGVAGNMGYLCTITLWGRTEMYLVPPPHASETSCLGVNPDSYN
jgi:hypothetical protein